MLALQAFFATCLEREPTQTPKILLSVSRHVPLEETREVNLRLCRAFVECRDGKAMSCVASVLRHQRMKALTMDFMVQNMGYEEPQGRLRITRYILEHLTRGGSESTFSVGDLTKIFFAATQRFLNEPDKLLLGPACRSAASDSSVMWLYK